MCRRYLERAMASGSGRLRVVAEVDFGSDPADWREGQRFESVYNRLLGAAPVSAVCLYDRRRLPAAGRGERRADPPAAGPAAPPGRRVRRFQDPGSLRAVAAPAARAGRGRRAGLRRGRRPHAGRPPPPARRGDRLPRARPRPAGGPPPGGRRDRGQRLPARRPAGVGAGVGRRGPRHLRHLRPRAPATATRSPGSPRPTASTCPTAAWACGSRASSGTTSTCCPTDEGLSVRLSTRLR